MQGETCSTKDQFWYSSEDKQLYATVIQCCDSTSCTFVFVDDQGTYQFLQSGTADAYNTFHVRNMMRNGSFSENIYLMQESFEVCNVFDYKVLRDQSISAGVNGVEYGAEVFAPTTARKITTWKKLLQGAGLLDTFNPIDFGVSIACTSNIDAHEKAIQKLSECYAIASNIRRGVVAYGEVPRLEVCNGEAKAIIEPILQSLKEQLASLASFVGNFFMGLWDMSVGNRKEFNIKKSEYDQLQEFQKKIGENPTLQDPKASMIGEASYRRIEAKAQTMNTEIGNATDTIKKAHDVDKLTIIYWTKNLFIEPNYNYPTHKEMLKRAENLLTQSNENAQVKKYNTATQLAIDAATLAKNAEDATTHDDTIPRHLDRRWKNALIVGAIVATIGVVAGWFITRKSINDKEM